MLGRILLGIALLAGLLAGTVLAWDPVALLERLAGRQKRRVPG